MLTSNKRHRVTTISRFAGAGISLRKRRRWFADDDTTEQQSKGAAESDSKYNPADLDEAMKIINSLNKRVGERDSALDELRKQVDAIQANERKRQEEEGDYKSLYEKAQSELQTLKPKAEYADDATQQFANLNKRALERVPETMRVLVPDFGDGYNGQKKLAEWLTNNMDMLTKAPAPNLDGGVGRNTPNAPAKDDGIDPDVLEVAKRMGVSAEDLKKANKPD